MRESLPLAMIFREILGHLAARKDAVVFGAHAVNAYCEPERMTADIDVLSTNAADLSEAMRNMLAERFHIAVRVREVVPGGFRIYQIRAPKNRHLVDVRQVDMLPPHRRIEGIGVIEPVELAAMKAISLARRKRHEKGLSDRLDLYRLLRALPELRAEDGVVVDRMRALGATETDLTAWREVVREPLEGGEDE
jgi:hypothetical protein